MRLLRLLRRFLHVSVVLALVALNVATLTVGAVAEVLGSLVEAATGTKPLHVRQRAEIDRLGTENRAQAERISRLNADYKRQSDALATRERELQRQRTAFERQRSTLSRQSASLAEERRRAGALANDLNSERERAAGLSSALENQRRTTAHAREVTGRSVARIQTRLSGRAEKKVLAAFGQAIPIAGIAVVAGMTAYELKSLCDTMRDLSEIDDAFALERATADEAQMVCGMEAPTLEDLQARVLASPGVVWSEMQAVLPDLGLGWLNPF
ncbi:MAG: hypothetical protein AAGI34_03745 [Pseudomonadota bacterium]